MTTASTGSARAERSSSSSSRSAATPAPAPRRTSHVRRHQSRCGVDAASSVTWSGYREAQPLRVREGMLEDVDGLVRLDLQLEGLAALRVDDRDDERVVLRPPDQAHLDPVALPPVELPLR